MRGHQVEESRTGTHTEGARTEGTHKGGGSFVGHTRDDKESYGTVILAAAEHFGTPVYSGLRNTANFVYGLGATSYTLNQIPGLQTAFEMPVANGIFNTLGWFNIVTGAFGLLNVLNEERKLWGKRDSLRDYLTTTDWRRLDNLLQAASSGTLLASAYNYLPEVVTVGSSTALAYLSGATAIYAATKLIKDGKRYHDAKRYLGLNESDRNAQALVYKARSDLILSTLNFVGWTAFCLAHVPAIAAAAPAAIPALIGVAAGCLVVGGLWAGYTLYRDYQAGNSGSKLGLFGYRQTLNNTQEQVADKAAKGELRPGV